MSCLTDAGIDPLTESLSPFLELIEAPSPPDVRALADLLVKLYDLPDVELGGEQSGADALPVRPAMAYEKHAVVAWVQENFGPGWASECDVAFANWPISCCIATQAGAIVGFACYDSTCRGFFGPIGVADAVRGRGVGRALLLSCLRAMAAAGYAYAIVGGVDSPEFYARTVGAIEIPGSTPGVYRDRLRKPAS
jgi:GNAT superfamily N-acetyltransferase